MFFFPTCIWFVQANGSSWFSSVKSFKTKSSWEGAIYRRVSSIFFFKLLLLFWICGTCFISSKLIFNRIFFNRVFRNPSQEERALAFKRVNTLCMSTMSTRQPYHPRNRSLLSATRDPEDVVCPFFSWKHYLPLEGYLFHIASFVCKLIHC